MYCLKTFGTLALEGQTGVIPPGAAQKRRLALLAIIASAGKSGMPREKAALLLWPESDTESARHSLSQLLYSIRQTLGADPMISTSGNLSLNPEIMTNDIADLDRAIKDHDVEKVVSIYKGKFLDGFNLPESLDFERWMESERARRHSSVIAELDKYASRSSAAGNHASAAEWWRKAATLEPLDSRIAVSLIKALDAAGNRPGALQHATIHSELVHEELGIAPDPIVTELARNLRTPPLPAPVFEPRSEAPPVTSGIAPVSSPAAATAQTGTNRRAIGGIVAMIAAVIVLTVVVARRDAQPSPAGGTAIAVLPFSVHGDSSTAYLREGLVSLLSSDLDGAGDLRAVDTRALLKFSAANQSSDDRAHADAVARHFNASLFVVGEASEAGGKIRISAQLYNRHSPDTPLSTASVEGDRTKLFELVDELVSNLVAGRYKGPRERLAKSAAGTTQSLPALKAYLNGEQELRAGRYSRAVESFERATHADTAFALAYYRMSIAAEWEGRPDLQTNSVVRAVRFSSRLSDHDRNLVKGLAARRERNPDKAESIYRQIVLEFPDDVEAWYQLGEVLFHDNAIRGRSFTESREAWDHVLAYVPNDVDALLHLIRVLARTGPHATLDSMVTSSLGLLTPAQRLETEALRAFVIGSSAAQDSVMARLRAATQSVVWQSLWRVAIYGRNFSGAERIAGILVEPSRPTVSKSIGHAAKMMLSAAHGRLAKARDEGADVPRSYPWSRDVGYLYIPMLGFARTDVGPLRTLRNTFEAWKPVSLDESQVASDPHGALAKHYRLYASGLLSVAIGDNAAANRYADEVRLLPAPASAGAIPGLFSTLIKAAALRRAGNTRDALATLEGWKGAVPIEVGGVLGVESYYGWLRAELLNESGRDLEALRWYETRSDLFIVDAMYLAPALYRAASIYEKRGNRSKAIAAYRGFIDLCKDADPELQPFVSNARERLKTMGSSI
jgi:DNA-binding SARP family transcriptional activator/TolB-like protein